MLIGSDRLATPIAIQGICVRHSAWDAYGLGQPRGVSTGFIGTLYEHTGALYQFGNGYRPYVPALRRFGSLDSLSPFGGGGINAYAYCLAEPINFSDPNGQAPTRAFDLVEAAFSQVLKGGVVKSRSSAKVSIVPFNPSISSRQRAAPQPILTQVQAISGIREVQVPVVQLHLDGTLALRESPRPTPRSGEVMVGENLYQPQPLRRRRLGNDARPLPRLQIPPNTQP